MSDGHVISVVVPSLNHGEFLQQCLRSILCQEGAFIIDCVVMDGGSRDGSVEVMRHHEELLLQHCEVRNWSGGKLYAPRDPAFQLNKCQGISYRWKSGKDRGQVDALRKGFELAQGGILCWLNSDDYYLHCGVFERVAELFEETPDLSMLFGDGVLVSRRGEPYGRHHVDSINLRELVLLDYHILQPASFFRRGLYSPTDLNDGYDCAFDADFFIGKISRGERYAKLAEPFAAFRLHDASKTIAMQEQKSRELLRITRTYCRSRYLRAVSTLYRHAEIALRPQWPRQRSLRRLLFRFVRVLCYFLIIGWPRRGHT